MMRLLVLVTLVSCVPDEEPLGNTAWTLAVDGLENEPSHLAANGDMVVVAGSNVLLIDRSGHERWSAPHDVPVLDVALDSDGSVAVLLATGPVTDRELVIERLGADGQREYLLQFPEAKFMGTPILAIDARRIVWLVFDHFGTSDLGGGVIGMPMRREARWAQFDRLGSYLGSAVLGFSLLFNTEDDGSPLPAGGIVMRDERAQMVALGPNGELLWIFGLVGGIPAYVVHDDGEITFLHPKQSELVRLDAQRTERWRRSLSCSVGSHAGLADGSVVFVGFDGLPSSYDLACLLRVDRDGDIERELFGASFGQLAHGISDGYRLTYQYGHVDLTDRSLDIESGAIVARQFP